MDKVKRIRELVDILNEAGKVYYSEGNEIMSNFEYDKLYDELKELEQESGFVLSNSPTMQVGYEVLSQLPKERHEKPMLSLDKTKDPNTLREWLEMQTGLLSWKLDGLTVVLTYQNGNLQKAVTRGNGEIGEVITNNAKVFKNLPLTIPYKGQLIIRGEAVISYTDFEKINNTIPETAAKYKNPRNLCSGSVRQLNNKITAERNVNLYVFSLVQADGIDFKNSRISQMEWLKSQGFSVVEYKVVTQSNLLETITHFENNIEHNNIPSDGLVILYDNISYGDSLGTTSKFPRNSMAFKWTDETRETTLLQIEWSPSRTGLINPIAVFEPVELEGTNVSRASVHNLSILEGLELGEGDTIVVYKANMIIPQIAENLTRSGVKEIPSQCPVCGSPTEIHKQNDVKALYCMNPKCQAKHIKRFVHFVSRDAMNIEGLSEATLEKFISGAMIHEYSDLYHLNKYQDIITTMEGFGEKSYQNMIASIEKSRQTTLPKVIYSLGMANIGLSNAKMICKALADSKNVQHPANMLPVTDLSDQTQSEKKAEELSKLLFNLSKEFLCGINGVGEVIADSFVSYFQDDTNRRHFLDLLAELHIIEEESASQTNTLVDKTFVITGNIDHFSNRNKLKDFIEGLGGKTTGSVTSKTDYLINNDNLSSSSKNKTAQKLGIPVITEAEFLKLAQREDLL